MKILAIDSSGLVASVALVTEDTVLAEYSTNFKKTHSQTLLPMVDEVMRMTGIEGDELDAIAVTNGPGSYTGLRIGSATAKGLGLAWNKPIVPVPTVDMLAANFPGCDSLICPIMDARRGQVYSGLYHFRAEELEIVQKQSCTLLSDMIARINEMGERVIFLGDGVADKEHNTLIKDALRLKVVDNDIGQRHLISINAIDAEQTADSTPMHRLVQNAASLGFLAVRLLKEGKSVPAMELVPEYLRLCQAEREREERLEQKGE